MRVRPGLGAGGPEYQADGTIGRGLTRTDEKIREFRPGPRPGKRSKLSDLTQRSKLSNLTK